MEFYQIVLGIYELCDIIEELRNMCIDMQEKLDEIDESLEFETVDDEDEIDE
jgi:hypothetical protein